MRSLLVLLCAAACGSTPHTSATAKPRVIKYTVVTVDRPSGSGELSVAPDGTHRAHFQYNDRGRGPDLISVATFDGQDRLVTLHVTGHAYHGQPVDEKLEAVGDQLVWSSASERGKAQVGRYYVPMHDALAWYGPAIRAMLRAPTKRIPLLPGGEAWIEDEHVVEVGGLRLRQIAIAGFGFEPSLMWIDEDGEYFANVSSWFSVIRTGHEQLIKTLIDKDTAWLAARSAKLAQSLSHRPPPAGLAITHARVFDAERKTIIPDATVVVVGDKITAVGNVAVPAGAQVIDARGRTLLPGLWDMHVHIGDGEGLRHLAFGVTTVRDMGNTIDELAARIARYEAGTEIGPRVIRAGFVDGPGKLAAPTGILAGTPQEAKAAVDRYADAGYPQLKIYSSITPELVPVLADAAHARGMRVSGHIPNKLRATDAVNAGYDEIQHANFLMLQFLAGPDDDTRTPLRFSRVAEQGGSLDLDSKPVTDFLDFLVKHHTVIDPTVATFEDLFVSNPGETDPGFKPYLGRLPAQIERGTNTGGLDAPGNKRAVFRKSYAAMLDLVVRAWKRGVPVVAGTDATAGMFLSRELELYVQGGIPATDVLAIATIGAARVMKMDKTAGSIAVGKVADLVLVDGDPTQDISTVRNADVVICRGIYYDPRELFTAVGMRPRAK
jgi:imidazolonepropionase-like amidohydrolase